MGRSSETYMLDAISMASTVEFDQDGRVKGRRELAGGTTGRRDERESGLARLGERGRLLRGARERSAHACLPAAGAKWAPGQDQWTLVDRCRARSGRMRYIQAVWRKTAKEATRDTRRQALENSRIEDRGPRIEDRQGRDDGNGDNGVAARTHTMQTTRMKWKDDVDGLWG